MVYRRTAGAVSDERKRNISFVLTIILSSVYLIWRIFFTIPWSAGILQAGAGVMLAAAEVVTTGGMIELMVSRMKSKDHEIPLPDMPDALFPDVDVFIATHNESPELLYKTVNACTFLEYPDKGKVHIYVCDDGNRREIKEMAGRLGNTGTATGCKIVLPECISVLVDIFVQDDLYPCTNPVRFVRVPARRVRILGTSFVLASFPSVLPYLRGISQWKYPECAVEPDYRYDPGPVSHHTGVHGIRRNPSTEI